MFFQTLVSPLITAQLNFTRPPLLNNEYSTYLHTVFEIYRNILVSGHVAATLFQQSGLTQVELISNEIRLKESNSVAALLCVSPTETKVKETITLGNQKVKKNN